VWYLRRVTRVAERSQLTAAEYLAWEREQEAKHEFFHGEVFAMSGGSYRHNALGMSIGSLLRATLRGRGCFVLTSDQRVSLWNEQRYVYPDATVVCGAIESQAGTNDVLLNPAVLVEVLSKSTELYDRGLKWEGYQRIASLTDYLLVSQAKVQIEQFRRREGNHWDYASYGPGERVVLTSGAELDLDAIFDGVFALAGD
jgi:Uma2 family endonuclease